MQFFIKPKKLSDAQKEILKIKEDIKECEFLINRNKDMFDLSIDEDLIEARIYEMKSLNKHHQYLIRLLKEKQECKTDNKIIKDITV